MTQGSWWQYSIDYDYIKSIGGIAKCFNPATRDGTNDIGAYNSGTLKTSPVTTCVPTIPPDHAGPPGGVGGTDAGGSASVGGTTGTTTGGMTGTTTGGTTGTTTGGSATTGAGAPGSGGSGVGTGTAGSAPVTTAGTSGATPNGAATTDSGGCGCRIGQQPSRSSLLFGLGAGALGAVLLGLRRRRSPRH